MHIRKMYVGVGKNIREIVREIGNDRKTVKKYINKDNWNEKLSKVKKEATFSNKQDFNTWLNEDKKAKCK